MTAIGKVLEALVGTSTMAAGLACAPTSPASLSVQVGPGQIISLQNLDSSAYGPLSADTTHQIMKQGLLMDAVTLACSAPGSAGQSINYLIQAAFQEVDGGATVLPYFNSSNPLQPYSGPSNTGTANFTQRLQQAALSVKAGTAATTGTQITPAPDSGCIGLYAVTVAYAQTTITAPNIVQLPTAPFISTVANLAGLVRKRLTANTTFYVSTTGNDGADGTTPQTAWATLQHAYDTVQKTYDINGFVATIQVADGTYTAGLAAKNAAVGGTIIFQGNMTTPSNCVVSTTNSQCFQAANGAQLQVQGFTLQASGSTLGIAIYASQSGQVSFQTVNFGTCGNGHLVVSGIGQINAIGNYTISGSAPSHATAQEGTISFAGVTITLTGSPAFSNAFVVATACGQVFAYGCTFVNAATGSSWLATLNGVISTQGGALPGSNTGTTSTGGQKA